MGPRALPIFTLALVLHLLAAPVAAEAQPAGKVWRIGLLTLRPLAVFGPYLDALRTGLRDLGYAEGRNFELVVRSSEGNLEDLPELARELVSLGVDIIITAGPAPVRAAKGATSTIPIIFAPMGDPVRAGLAASLARPGGNLTGFSFQYVDVSSKYPQLLKEIVPKLSKIGVLWDPSVQGSSDVDAFRQITESTKILGLIVKSVEARGASDFEAAFDAMRRSRFDGVIVLPTLANALNRRLIAALALTHRLPAIHGFTEDAQAGALLTYGVSVIDLYRRAAALVDKIIRGARAADLPIEQPTKFELIINLKTAKALGLTIPPALLLRADQVIE